MPAGLTTRSRSATNEGVTEQTTEWVEDGLARTRMIQQMTAPGPYLDVDVTIEHEIVERGNATLLAMGNLSVISTTRFGVDVVTTSMTTFSPSLALRPLQLCRGQVWTNDATTTTSTTRSNGTVETTSGHRSPSVGRVIQWRTTIAVPAGTFETIHWEGTGVVNGGLFRTETWTSTFLGIPVRQISYGTDGALIQTTEMTGVGQVGTDEGRAVSGRSHQSRTDRGPTLPRALAAEVDRFLHP